MPLISIRYGIPLLIILYTAGLAVYMVYRDWNYAEAMVRGEAASLMMNRMSKIQKLYSQTLSDAYSGRVAEEQVFLSGVVESEITVITDFNGMVIRATNQEWIGQELYHTSALNWNSWLKEPLQTIVERVRKQPSGEVFLMGEGRYLLGVYPLSFSAPNVQAKTDHNRVLVVQRDLSRDLTRARNTVGKHTAEMVSLLVLMAVIIGILVHIFLTRRLGKLVTVTELFADGNFQIRTKLSGNDEVAKLGRAFDNMAGQVEDTHKDLELRVVNRTTELASSVAELQREIAERRRIEHMLFNEKERIQVTLASIGDAVITTNVNGQIDYINPVAKNLVGIPHHLIIGNTFPVVFNLIDEITRQPVQDPVQQCLIKKNLTKLGNCKMFSGNGDEERSLDISAAPIHDRENTMIGVVLICRDVTEINRIARQLSYHASHDSLTGLINRMEFERRLQRVISTAKIDEFHALLYLDLDQFKIVNDTCGHIAGDELLRQVSAVLDQKIRKRDTLARLGGDEFGVLLEHCLPDQALQIANKMRMEIHDYRFLWEDRSFRIGVSIGLVPITPGVDTLASVFRTADSACYAAKELGRNRVHIYQTGDFELAQRHGEMQWIPRIQEALAKNQFVLYYQPIVPINGKYGLHYEVLLRLVNLDGDLMLPSVFIPVAERYNQMQAIDRWVVQHAFAALRDPEIVPEFIGLAINISGQSLSDPLFLEFVESQIVNQEIPIERVCFEITETAAIGNLIHAQRFFSALKPRGCRFALDDFGSGLSSFAYLKTLPIDFLKIDGSFVKDMASDPIDYAMVEAIHRIGNVMGIETIAEFVETECVLEQLKSIGVNYGQGHCLAIPRPLVPVGSLLVSPNI
ncbi:MAG: EAL domain-containing protein [Methyloglobulus sp.]|nr:EAL domain-containing protein [Methyloglobulus sp.]